MIFIKFGHILKAVEADEGLSCLKKYYDYPVFVAGRAMYKAVEDREFWMTVVIISVIVLCCCCCCFLFWRSEKRKRE